MVTRKTIVALVALLITPEFLPLSNHATAGPFRRPCWGGRRILYLPRCQAPRPVYLVPLEREALRPCLRRGAVFYSLRDSTTEQVMTVMNQVITQEQGQTFAVKWNTRGIDGQGNWIIDAKILAIKMHIDIGGNIIQYDSTDKAATPHPYAGFFSNLLGADFRFIVQS